MLDFNQILQILQNDKLNWKSYNIDWEYPNELRYWVQIDNVRYCFQKFIGGSSQVEGYFHNHPWRKEMYIFKGKMKHYIGTTNNVLDYFKKEDKRDAYLNAKMFQDRLIYFIHGDNTYFDLCNPNCWHALEPIDNEIYSLMITHEPWFKGPKSPNKNIKQLTELEVKDIKNTISECLKKLIN